MNKDKILLITFAVIAILFLLLCVVSAFMLVFKYSVVYAILSAVSAAGVIIFYLLELAKSRKCKIKYLFLGKKYRLQVSDSIRYFTGAEKSFIKNYMKSCKYNYRRSGNIHAVDYSANQYIDTLPEIRLPKVICVLQILYDSILFGGGFVEFCDKTAVQNFEDNYEVLCCTQYKIIPAELRYICLEVFLCNNFESQTHDDYVTQLSSLLVNFKDIISDLLEIYSKGVKSAV